MLAAELISSVLQVLVFSLVPLIVHLVSTRSPVGFLRSIGLYRPEARTVWYAVAATLALFPIMWGAFFAAGNVELLYVPGTVAGMLRAAGLSPETVRGSTRWRWTADWDCLSMASPTAWRVDDPHLANVSPRRAILGANDP